MKLADINKANKYRDELAAIDGMIEQVGKVRFIKSLVLSGGEGKPYAEIETERVPDGVQLEIRRVALKYLHEQRHIILKAIEAL